MKYAVKKIKCKKPYEIYTPCGANKDGFSDRDEFKRVFGNIEFHSFQVWREKVGAKATCVYALTLEQLENIQKIHVKEKSSLKARVTRLSRQKSELQLLQAELEKIAAKNQQLQQALLDAKAEVADAAELAAMLQHNVDVLADRVPEESMNTSHRSLTPSAAQLVVEARTDKVYKVFSIPTNGQPSRNSFQVNRYNLGRPPPKVR